MSSASALIEKLIAIVGKENVITSSEKDVYAKDYTKQFKINTLAAVLPVNSEQVSLIVKACLEAKVGIVPSGGRTGLCGGAVATQGEIVLSLQKMNKIFEVNSLDQTLSCQAGAVTKAVQKAAEEHDLYFPVDFASSGSSHIGGNIATNAGGIKVIRYGLMREWVQGLKVVTGTGEILDMQNASIKNNTGYDLKQIFVGSEGTLGIITECLIKLTTPPGELKVALFALKSLEDVTKLFELALTEKLPLTAYEFFTDIALKHVQMHTHKNAPFAETHSHYVLLETESDLEGFVEKAFAAELVVDGVMASSSAQAQDFWALRENISESLSMTAVVHKNDISLPISKITAFCGELKKMLNKNYPGIEVVLFGHIGDGNLHVNFIKPENQTNDAFFGHAKKADLEMFALVNKFGGSISAEHGIGLTKKDYLNFTRSPQEIQIMKQMKKIFDPSGIMNPGKIF